MRSVNHQKHQGWRLVKNADFWAVAERILMTSKTLLSTGIDTRNNSLLLSVKREL